jgi:lipid A 3-O-deacylase
MTMKKIGILSSLVILWALVITPSAWSDLVPDQNGSGWLYVLSAGVFAHDVDGLWSGSRRESGVDLNVELILSRPNFTLPTGIVRPNYGVTVNDRGDTSKLYAGLIWEVDTPSGIFMNVGVGCAFHDGELEAGRGDKKGLGSRLLFRIPMEVGYTLNRRHRLSIAFAHVSNAYLADPNEGLDTLGLRYGYRF